MPESELTIALRAKDKASREFQKVERSSKKLGRTLGDVLGRISLRSVVGTAALIKLGGSLKGITDQRDEIGKLADRLGFTTETLTTLELQAEKSGVEIAVLRQALGALTRRLGEAQAGNKAFADGFARLGIDITASKGAANEAEIVYLKAADAISKLGSQAEKAAAADRLFSEAGRRLVITLDQGTAGLRKFRTEAEKRGILFSREEAAEAEAFNDALTDLGKSFDGLLSKTLPAVQLLTKAFEGLTEALDGSLGEDAQRKINQGAGVIGRILGGQSPLDAFKGFLGQQATDLVVPKVVEGMVEVGRQVKKVGQEAKKAAPEFDALTQAMLDAVEVFAVRPENLGFLDGMTQALANFQQAFERSFSDTYRSGLELTEDFLDDINSEFGVNFFDFMRREIKSLEDLFSALFDSIIAGLQRILAQQTSRLVAGGFSSLFGSLFGGPGAPSGIAILNGGGSIAQPEGGIGGTLGSVFGPGRGNTPGIGGGGYGNVNISINAVDSESFTALVARNPNAFVNTVINGVSRSTQARGALRAALS